MQGYFYVTTPHGRFSLSVRGRANFELEVKNGEEKAKDNTKVTKKTKKRHEFIKPQ